MHLQTFDLTLKDSYCSRIMLIPLCIQALQPQLSLQEHVDAWKHCIGRPRLHGCAETVHLSLESPCICLQGVTMLSGRLFGHIL